MGYTNSSFTSSGKTTVRLGFCLTQSRMCSHRKWWGIKTISIWQVVTIVLRQAMVFWVIYTQTATLQWWVPVLWENTIWKNSIRKRVRGAILHAHKPWSDSHSVCLAYVQLLAVSHSGNPTLWVMNDTGANMPSKSYTLHFFLFSLSTFVTHQKCDLDHKTGSSRHQNWRLWKTQHGEFCS